MPSLVLVTSGTTGLTNGTTVSKGTRTAPIVLTNSTPVTVHYRGDTAGKEALAVPITMPTGWECSTDGATWDTFASLTVTETNQPLQIRQTSALGSAPVTVAFGPATWQDAVGAAPVTSGLVLDLRASRANSTTNGPHSNSDSDKATWYADTGTDATLGTGWAYTASDGWTGDGTPGAPYCLISDGGGSVTTPSLTLTSFTAEVWVKAATAADFEGVFDNFVSAPGGGTDYAADGFMLDLASGANRGKPRFTIGRRRVPTVAGDQNGTALMWNTAINDGSWHHVMFWYDASNTTIGLTVDDGTPLTTSAPDVSLTEPSSTPRRLFGDGASTNFMVGSIAQFRIYNRVLTSGERTANYGAGVGA